VGEIEIGEFSDWKNLASISIPASVERIGYGAFDGCTSLTEVTFAIDSRLRKMDGFRKCTSLSRIEIPASVEETDVPAFSECTGLTEVRFAADSGLKRISGFQRCTALNRLEIPASVEEIDLRAFSGCSGLTYVIFAPPGCRKRLYGFGKCSSLSRVEIPASVEKVSPSTERSYGSVWFLGDVSRRELIYKSGTRLRPHVKRQYFRGFVVFEDENDLKGRRRQVHLRT
jgi:hypothetical protein